MSLVCATFKKDRHRFGLHDKIKWWICLVCKRIKIVKIGLVDTRNKIVDLCLICTRIKILKHRFGLHAK